MKVLLHHIKFYMYKCVILLNDIKHILRSHLNLVCAHKLEIDAPVNVASESFKEFEEKVYNGTMDH